MNTVMRKRLDDLRNRLALALAHMNTRDLPYRDIKAAEVADLIREMIELTIKEHRGMTTRVANIKTHRRARVLVNDHGDSQTFCGLVGSPDPEPVSHPSGDIQIFVTEDGGMFKVARNGEPTCDRCRLGMTQSRKAI
jgi:hypothetical protein